MSSPLLLRLTRPVDCRPDRFRRRVRRLAEAHRADPARLLPRFAFRCDERAFAEALLRERTHWWLFRTHQAAACGDFVVVDLSSPRPVGRRVVGLDLKLGGRLRTASHQLRHLPRAVRLLEARVLVEAPRVERYTGDARLLESVLGGKGERAAP